MGLRDASGTLQNGRSVLGTVVDPLGVFRSSSLLRVDTKDEEIVDTTLKLITLAQNQIDRSSSLLPDAGSPPSVADAPTSLFSDRATVIKLASMITTKFWERRFAVRATGNRFANQVLNVTVTRLEEKENPSARIPATAR